jgi:hypothetical protein
MNTKTTIRLLAASRFLVLAALVVSYLAFTPSPCLAVDWESPFTAYYDSGSAWIGGAAPLPIEDAGFNVPSSYSVLWDGLTGNTTSANLNVGAGSVTFSQNGGTGPYKHTVTNDATVDVADFKLGEPSNQLNLTVGDTLAVQNDGFFQARYGSDVVADKLEIGAVAGVGATIRIDGVGTTLDVSGATTLGANGSSGSLFIEGASNGSHLARSSTCPAAAALATASCLYTAHRLSR